MGYRRSRAGSLAHVSSFEGEKGHESRAKARTSRSGCRPERDEPLVAGVDRARPRPPPPLAPAASPPPPAPSPARTNAVVGDPEQALHLGHVRAVHVRRRKPQGSRLLWVHLTAPGSSRRRAAYVKPTPCRCSRSSSARRRSAAARAPCRRSAACVAAAARPGRRCPAAPGAPRRRSPAPRRPP